ncbi:MAG TPA: hypothetical protein VHE78_06215 [Gemmatimonadaceae bacterium]|nr:hypothetical protein [Gemmatimonadaceae bacterium]
MRSQTRRWWERKLICVPATLLVVSAAHVHGQNVDTVRVGGRALHTEWIQPTTDTLALFIRKGAVDRPVATLIGSVTRAVVDGQAAWLLVQAYHTPSGDNVDSSVVLAATLAPVRYSSIAANSNERFTFADTLITGTVTPRDSAQREIRLQLREPVFNAVVDNAMIVAALPLAEGYAATYRSYNPPRGFGTTMLRVSGAERLQTARGVVDAWIVSLDAGGAPTTLWVDTRTHRVIRLRAALAGGAEFWKLPAADQVYVVPK